MGEVEYIKKFNAIHAKLDAKILAADGDAKQVVAALDEFRNSIYELEANGFDRSEHKKD